MELHNEIANNPAAWCHKVRGYRLWSNWIASISSSRIIRNEGRSLWSSAMSSIRKWTQSDSLGKALSISDAITLHVSATKANKSTINVATISQRKDEAILVNNVCGTVLDIEAVAGALWNVKLVDGLSMWRTDTIPIQYYVMYPLWSLRRILDGARKSTTEYRRRSSQQISALSSQWTHHNVNQFTRDRNAPSTLHFDANSTYIIMFLVCSIKSTLFDWILEWMYFHSIYIGSKTQIYCVGDWSVSWKKWLCENRVRLEQPFCYGHYSECVEAITRSIRCYVYLAKSGEEKALIPHSTGNVPAATAVLSYPSATYCDG